MKTSSALFTASLALFVSASLAAAQDTASPLSNPAQATAPAAPQAQAPAQNAQADAEPDPDIPDDPGVNDVRIVRLSQVLSKVEMDRGTDKGYERAYANMPVVKGAKLRTTAGVAEVEFEDTSTLRLAPDSAIEFPTLSRNADGSTSSTVHVFRGTVYVSLEKAHGAGINNLTLVTSKGTAVLPPGSRVRLTLGFPESHFAVLEGRVTFKSTLGDSTEVGKKQQLNIDGTGTTSPLLLAKLQPNPFDQWNSNQEEFHKRYAKGSALSGSSSIAGITDLNYYGSWINSSGCGRIWRPYFTSAAWDPYANGSWVWYPGFGYTWVSAYPWGWAPFHAGSWLQCSAGWGWMPENNYGGFRGPRHNQPGGPRGPHDPNRPIPIRHPYPTHPPHRPFPGHPVVVVNQKPVAPSGIDPRAHSFVFRADSAGIGVPRQMFGNLNHVSRNVDHHGEASVEMHRVGQSDTGGRDNVASGVGNWRPVAVSDPGIGNVNNPSNNSPSITSSYNPPVSSTPAPSAPSSSGDAVGVRH